MIKINGKEVEIDGTGEEFMEEFTMVVAIIYKTMKEADFTSEEARECFIDLIDTGIKAVDEVDEGKDLFIKFLDFLKKEREENE